MIGKTISHYKIIEQIGAGGMGVVYKVQDTKLDRFVALKFLPPHLTSSEDEKQRFIHEAKAASALQHNNICNIHEIDETEEGQLFICMDYYDGDTLDKKIKDKPLPIDEAIDISNQIAQGLAKAHEKDIVHRDIKPANIMLTSDGVVKILDFGLAKLSTQTKLTKEGTTLGTIAYMSPEQTRGESVDHRSDIWSLGVILYEMLSGQLPFKGDYEQAVMYGIANETPEPISGLRSGIPIELERIVMRMLEKDPRDRYQHVDDLLSELNKLRRDSGLGKTTSRKTLTRKWQRNLILPMVLFAIILTAFTLYWLFRIPDEGGRNFLSSQWVNSIAVLPFDNLSNDTEQEIFCEGMTQQILTSLSKLPDIKIISYTSVKKYQNSQKSLPQIAAELGVDNILEGSVSKFGERIRVQAQLIRANDDAHLWAEKYDYEFNIERLFTIYDDISEKIAGALLRNLSSDTSTKIKGIKPTDMDAYELYLKGSFYHNEFLLSAESKHFKLTEEYLLQAIQKDSNYVTALAELADFYTSAYYVIDSSEQQTEFFKKARSYLARAEAINPNIAMVPKVKAILYWEDNDLDQAYIHFKKALSIDPNHLSTLWDLAMFYEFIGLYKQAIYSFSRAIELDPLETTYRATRAQYYLYQLEERAKALGDINQVLAVEPENRVALQTLFWYHIRRRDLNGAGTVFEKYQAAYPDSPNIERFMAYLLALRGKKNEALAIELNNYDLSFLYCYLGMNEQAVGLLKVYYDQQRLERKRSAYLQLKNNTFLDSVRNDPRFQAILAEHKELYYEYLKKYGEPGI